MNRRRDIVCLLTNRPKLCRNSPSGSGAVLRLCSSMACRSRSEDVAPAITLNSAVIIRPVLIKVRGNPNLPHLEIGAVEEMSGHVTAVGFEQCPVPCIEPDLERRR